MKLSLFTCYVRQVRFLFWVIRRRRCYICGLKILITQPSQELLINLMSDHGLLHTFINTFDSYSLNDFVRHKIITVSMTLNFNIPIIPSKWVSYIDTGESLLSRFQTTPLNMFLVILIHYANAVTWPKMPL